MIFTICRKVGFYLHFFYLQEVKGSVIPFHSVSELLPSHHQATADEDSGSVTRPAGVQETAALLLRQRSRTPGCHPLQAVLLTHLREARQPWRQQDRSFLAFQISFESCGGDDQTPARPPLVLETYANSEDQAWQEHQLDGLTAVGFLPCSLFGVATRVAASLSVWSADMRLSDLVRYCRLAARCLLLQNAAGSLVILCAESERVAIIRILDQTESNTFSCILKLNRHITIFI